MGRVRATRVAMRANLRGLPNDSVYMAITRVRSSSSQNCKRSFPEMSRLSPSDTNQLSPTSSCWASCSTDEPRVPDCIEMATTPGRRSPCASDACSAGASPNGAEAIPMLAGPTMRNPLRRACSTMASRSMPSRVSSTAVTTTAPRTRLVMHSSMVRARAAAGTATTANHTSSSISVTDATHRTSPIEACAGFTG